jgi:pyruvate dehydrogenase E2 component (dihydrolipoamide acetyltransferase)
VEAYLELQPKASPVARRLADHEGVDLHAVRGTGPGGRVLKSDVEGAVATGREAVAGEPTEEVTEALEGAPIRGIRATIARRMHEAHQTTAPVTLTSEVNATAFVDLRERLKASLFDQLQFNVSYNDLLIKVVARALREFPYVNARLERGPSEELTGKVVRHEGGAHIGLAVDTERGLLVPVLRNADQKDLIEIARSVRKLIDRAQSGDATPDELTGGAFTITNLGPYDVDAFTPIINLPEVAILGVGRIRSAPAVVGDEITIQQKLWLSLTFDHRLVDGAPAARFLQYVKTLIEEPFLLLV